MKQKKVMAAAGKVSHRPDSRSRELESSERENRNTFDMNESGPAGLETAGGRILLFTESSSSARSHSHTHGHHTTHTTHTTHTVAWPTR